MTRVWFIVLSVADNTLTAFQLPTEDLTAIDTLAADRGCSRSALLREGVWAVLREAGRSSAIGPEAEAEDHMT